MDVNVLEDLLSQEGDLFLGRQLTRIEEFEEEEGDNFGEVEKELEEEEDGDEDLEEEETEISESSLSPSPVVAYASRSDSIFASIPFLSDFTSPLSPDSMTLPRNANFNNKVSKSSYFPGVGTQPMRDLRVFLSKTRVSREKPLSCPEIGCKMIFYKKQDFVGHMLHNHIDIKYFNCNSCGKEYFMRKGLAQHSRSCQKGQQKTTTNTSNIVNNVASISPSILDLTGKEQQKTIPSFEDISYEDFQNLNPSELINVFEKTLSKHYQSDLESFASHKFDGQGFLSLSQMDLHMIYPMGFRKKLEIILLHLLQKKKPKVRPRSDYMTPANN